VPAADAPLATSPVAQMHDLLKEADRQLTICNACRYCEGYCAVWPAMELRRTFMCYVLNSKLNSVKSPKLSSLRPGSTVVLMTEKRMRPLEIAANDSFVGKNLGRLKSDWQRFTARP